VIPLLEPLFQGDWAPYGEALVCTGDIPRDAQCVADWWLPNGHLKHALCLHAEHLGTSDLRVAASSWSLHYLWNLLAPVTAAASLLQHVFPVLPPQLWVRLDGDGEPARFYFQHLGEARAGTDTATRFGPLLWQHLAPLFELIHCESRLPQKILWANAARYLGNIYKAALPLSGQSPAVLQDKVTLIDSPHWPDGRPNPLFGPSRQVWADENGERVRITLHRQCCLLYKLPGDSYCSACPLKPEFRGRLKDSAHCA
jgi:ferric iron reductase protein FhuF